MTLPANKLTNVRRRAERARLLCGGLAVTCPASRHAMLIADAIANGKSYVMIQDEREHCASSMYSVLESLWNARAEIRKLKAKK